MFLIPATLHKYVYTTEQPGGCGSSRHGSCDCDCM